MTVAPGMADRIDTAVSAQNPQAAPKALRNGPEFEEICIRFDDGFCESRDSDGNNRKNMVRLRRGPLASHRSESRRRKR